MSKILYDAPENSCKNIDDTFEAGKGLSEPIIRFDVNDYWRTCDLEGAPRVLNIGAGHITRPECLEQHYQHEGGYDMIAYTPHCLRHEGQYTVSIESGNYFNSDLVINIHNYKAQSILFQQNSWDLVIDTTFLWSVVIEENVLSKIASSLKPGGVLVFPIYIVNNDGIYSTGWPGFVECESYTFTSSIDKNACALEFINLSSVHQYIQNGLNKLGFDSTSLCLGGLSNIRFKGIDGIKFRDLRKNETLTTEVFERHPELQDTLCPEHPLAKMYSWFECYAKKPIDFVFAVAKVAGTGALPDIECDFQ
jgi:hypothetical protein